MSSAATASDVQRAAVNPSGVIVRTWATMIRVMMSRPPNACLKLTAPRFLT